MISVNDYLDEYGLDSIHGLDSLELKRSPYVDVTCERLALPDGENSIWVCMACGELCDPADMEEHAEDCCVLLGLDA